MSAQLSILIPFYRDDPTVLLESLDRQTIPAGSVNIHIMDDGSGDKALTDRLENFVPLMSLPTILTTAPTNRGRSVTRNALQDATSTDWILFLDADMRVDHTDFLSRYLEQIEHDDCDVIFGGFDVEDQSDDPDTDLHRVLSHSSDCLSAAERIQHGAQHVASSNLCIRKTVLDKQPFDSGFHGWGWEDSEWAARISRLYRLHHIDNPAVHLGLETTDTLLSRFATSGLNYRRFVEAHPELAQSLPLFRIISRLKNLPGHGLTRAPLKWVVRAHNLPIKLRVLALKFWRASHYAEAMK